MAEGGASLLDSVLAELARDRDSRASRMLLLCQARAQGARADGLLSALRGAVEREREACAKLEGEAPRVTGLLLAVNDVAAVVLLEADTRLLLNLIGALPALPTGDAKEAEREGKSASPPSLSLAKAVDFAGRSLPGAAAAAASASGGASLSDVFACARVAYFSEGVAREFPSLEWRAVRAAEEPEYATEDALGAAFSLYKDLIELGREGRAAGGRSHEFLQSSKPQVLSRLPSAERVLFLAQKSALNEVGEFLRLFNGHEPVDLDEEHVWPAEEPLRF